MTPALRQLPARVAAGLRSGRRRIALAWAAATLAALVALAGGPGISRDEADVVAAAGRVAEGWRTAAGHPLAALTGLEAARARSGGRPLPPLAPAVAAAGHAAGRAVGLSHQRAYRLGAAAAGALLSALLALAGHALAGPAGAALAPAMYWLAPRTLLSGAVALADGFAALLWLAAFWAYRRAAAAPDRLLRLRAAALAGLAFGAALATRLDAWVILPTLALHALLVRLLRPRAAEPAAEAAPVGIEARLRGVPVAIAAMAVLGPLALVALWPWLWPDPLHRALLAARAARAGAGEALAAGLPRPLLPLAVTAFAVPLAPLVAAAGGALQALARAARALRRGSGFALSDEILLLLGAAAPLAAAASGIVPALPGVRAWLPAFPFLALLGTRALLDAARIAWPARAAPLAAALALLVLYPAVRQAAHAWPWASSSWSALGGGTPGAASRGLARQDGGEAAAAVLDALAARARPGARVYWPRTAEAAIDVYRRDGRLRADLRRAESPEEADVAVVAVDGAARDAEYRTWAAFRDARPVAGAFLDEVPLVLVYARPGAWR
ncbi:glycosyltransferase family 39 protein [Anaeromyxobacter dehalogenans]|uniref:Glycosyltransferase RgtA/B/C/D-like domain-containing protein n=1 Tax=Anaeromyxobacter dehalogenans (strain 2CP-C) TaxID=290397 RepID=Q2IDG9_ANADE|nr:glycosyltransferase family 39 protein [Anaeromyxobacter dehalogenans]ABC82630.1 hypothetical protein Adeh_2860 [Anaeromyxobacter dehalogenans 2CP-C]